MARKGKGTRMQRYPRRLVVCCLFALAGLAAVPAPASDHADPVVLANKEANLTDLFCFPHGDQLVVIFDVRGALTDPRPYDVAAVATTSRRAATLPQTMRLETWNLRNLARVCGTRMMV